MIGCNADNVGIFMTTKQKFFKWPGIHRCFSQICKSQYSLIVLRVPSNHNQS